jgi:hypothetical protein
MFERTTEFWRKSAGVLCSSVVVSNNTKIVKSIAEVVNSNSNIQNSTKI